MSSEIEGADDKTGRGETIDNRGIYPGVVADSMHERDDRPRLYCWRPTTTEKGETFDASKIEFRERGRLHELWRRAELPVADTRWPMTDYRGPRLKTQNWVVLGARGSVIR